MKILGLHNSLESSVSLYINGKIVSALTEERFNRIKNFHGFPKKSLEYILKKHSIKLQELDYIIYGIIDQIYPDQDINLKFIDKINETPKKYHKKIKERIDTEIKWNKKHINNIKRFAKKNHVLHKLIFIDHHESHAASAYFCSPFKNANIFTFDGKGGFRSASHYIGNNEKFRRINFLTTFESLGYFYGNVTRAIGFKSERHEGKVTGLAAYGKKTKLIKSFEKIIISNNKSFHIKFGDHYMPWFCNKKSLPKFFQKLKKFTKEDVAYAAQYILEKTIINYIKKNIPKNKKTNICLAGGVFANVKLNQKIREIKNVKNVYIQPAMSDTGISLGSIYAFLSKKRKIKPKLLKSVALGSEYKITNIKNKIKKRYVIKKENQLENCLISEFAKGNPVGYFSGKMEFGPRALCQRSLLYHSKDVQINDWLNKKLNRTEFMPFAPVTIEEFGEKCFIDWNKKDRSADFMTMTYLCTKEFIKKCPASVHIDNTARPQIIRKKIYPKFHRILKNYLDKTGDLAIINTSFNRHEEPIVQDINDALSVLDSNIIKTLIVEDYSIKKLSISS